MSMINVSPYCNRLITGMNSYCGYSNLNCWSPYSVFSGALNSFQMNPGFGLEGVFQSFNNFCNMFPSIMPSTFGMTSGCGSAIQMYGQQALAYYYGGQLMGQLGAMNGMLQSQCSMLGASNWGYLNSIMPQFMTGFAGQYLSPYIGASAAVPPYNIYGSGAAYGSGMAVYGATNGIYNYAYGGNSLRFGGCGMACGYSWAGAAGGLRMFKRDDKTRPQAQAPAQAGGKKPVPGLVGKPVVVKGQVGNKDQLGKPGKGQQAAANSKAPKRRRSGADGTVNPRRLYL